MVIFSFRVDEHLQAVIAWLCFIVGTDIILNGMMYVYLGSSSFIYLNKKDCTELESAMH